MPEGLGLYAQDGLTPTFTLHSWQDPASRIWARREIGACVAIAAVPIKR
ncbi:MAG: hypothetical protein O2943_06070 [Actinomycetota bacterium]|nr:hypothetical protein [Actinomycetota bacterium]